METHVCRRSYDTLSEQHPIIQGKIFTMFHDSSFITDAFDRANNSQKLDLKKFQENYFKIFTPLMMLPQVQLHQIYSTTASMRQLVRKENLESAAWKLSHEDPREERHTMTLLLATLERCSRLLKAVHNPNYIMQNVAGILMLLCGFF